MFDKDVRSKKVILVSHCILNQNVKLDTLASYPGTVPELTEAIIKSGVGIVQMPCPELLGIGLDRRCVMEPTTESMKHGRTHVAELMNNEKDQKLCEDLAKYVVFQIKQYLHNGFEIVGIMGINTSPTCGVEITWSNDQEVSGKGVFMRKLTEELAKEKIELDMTGITPLEEEQAIQSLKKLIENADSKCHTCPTKC